MSQKTLTESELEILGRHSQIMLDFYHHINEVRKSPLHSGQVALARAYFEDNKKIIMSQWGRSAGKTETICYIAWRRALLYPGSLIYIICPQKTQGVEVYWASRRLPEYGPPKYIDNEAISQQRLNFKNGSFIKVDGCENREALRGVKPNLVFYDEFQDHSKEFDLSVMQPNLSKKGTSLIVCGTPPDKWCYYHEFKETLFAEIAAGDTTRMYLQFPTTINVFLDQVEIQKKINSLTATGNSDIARREYFGEDCFGGTGVVFVTWDRERLMYDHDILLTTVAAGKNAIKWITFIDPGNDVCFAALFCAYNPFTAQLFILDEIYEQDRKKTEPLSMWTRIVQKQREFYSGKWTTGYDSAASWWESLIRGNFGVSMVKSSKLTREISDDVAIMKSMMASNNSLFISKRCEKLVFEIENFITDDEGRYCSKKDHLLDCWRYILRHINFSFVEKSSPNQIESYLNDTRTEYIPPSKKTDWTEGILANEYDSESIKWNWKF